MTMKEGGNDLTGHGGGGGGGDGDGDGEEMRCEQIRSRQNTTEQKRKHFLL